jgi:ferritin
MKKISLHKHGCSGLLTSKIEEEAAVREILDKLRLVGDKNMYMFDRDILGMRAAGAAE